MTRLSRAVSLFPALVLALAAHAAVLVVRRPGLLPAAWLLFVLYGLPVAAFRVHQALRPLEPGVSFLDGKEYSPWWGGHALQSLYVAVPALEALLRLVPGAYSAWLRLWGSRVGRGVYWTPRVEVADRSLLEVGDGVIFGHEVRMFGHGIKPTRGGRLLLYARRITIGAGAFIGAGTRMGPGVVVEAGAVVPILSDLYPNRRFAKEDAREEPAR